VGLIESWVFMSATKDFEIIVNDVLKGLNKVEGDAFRAPPHIFGVQTFSSEPPFIVPISTADDPYALLNTENANRLSVYQGFLITSTGRAYDLNKEEEHRIMLMLYKDSDGYQNAIIFQESGEQILTDEEDGEPGGELYDAVKEFEYFRQLALKAELQKGCND